MNMFTERDKLLERIKILETEVFELKSILNELNYRPKEYTPEMWGEQLSNLFQRGVNHGFIGSYNFNTNEETVEPGPVAVDFRYTEEPKQPSLDSILDDHGYY